MLQSISCIAVYSEQYPLKVSSNDLMKIGDSSSGLVSDCICLPIWLDGLVLHYKLPHLQ